jgi:hypothetical protein
VTDRTIEQLCNHGPARAAEPFTNPKTHQPHAVSLQRSNLATNKTKLYRRPSEERVHKCPHQRYPPSPVTAKA